MHNQFFVESAHHRLERHGDESECYDKEQLNMCSLSLSLPFPPSFTFVEVLRVASSRLIAKSSVIVNFDGTP